MQRTKQLRIPVLLILCAVILLAASRTVFASNLMKITRPSDGSRVTPGAVEVYTTFTYQGGKISEFASQISPMIVQVLDSSGKVIQTKEWRVTVGRLDLIDTYRLDVDIPKEGTYTIRAAVPGAPNEWSSVKVTASYKSEDEENNNVDDDATNKQEDTGEWPEGSLWWNIIPNSQNPGYHISVDKKVYNIDLSKKDYARINFTMSVDKDLYEKDNPEYYASSDRLTAAGEKIFKFKDIGDQTYRLSGGKYITNTWLEYRALKPGTSKMQIFFLSGLKWYDVHEITLNAIGANTMTVKAKSPVLKAKTLAKKKQVIPASKAFTIKKAKGKVTFKKVKGNAKISVAAKTGKITVKKGLKKGTYKVAVNVTAAGTNIYKKLTKKVTVKIRVK